MLRNKDATRACKGRIRRIVLTWILAAVAGVSAYGRERGTERLIAELDSAIAASNGLDKAKETRIEQLRKRESALLKDEERLWLNKMLYDEYYVYKADSAMNYVNRNMELARRMGRAALENEWKINKVFLLSAQGLLSEAEKELQQIDPERLDETAKYSYYETAIYLYTHLSQYIGKTNGMTAHYDSLANSLRTKALQHISPTHPAYHSLRASMLSGPKDPDWSGTKARLKESVDKSPLNNRFIAIDAYRLAKMYLAEGNEREHVNYLIKSSIADLRMCNRDIASLEELSNILYEEGDIDRAYIYINHCLSAALLYPNRVRVVHISAVLDKLQGAIKERSIEQERKLSNYLLAVSILSGVLLSVTVITFIQFFKLKHAHAKLMKNESVLNEHMEELHETQTRLYDVNNELKEANEKLRQSNESLMESNYVKEEYVGYVFSICSRYLSKIEEFRKNIGRKLKVGKIDDVRAIISSQQIDKSELQEFYRRFDITFLHLYPHFVADFNSLLRAEEQITLKKGELLNTELRIYALVRLGINDSVKISEFLHMSTQTIYNTRLKIRNKAAVPKEEFAERVRQLGKGRPEGEKGSRAI